MRATQRGALVLFAALVLACGSADVSSRLSIEARNAAGRGSEDGQEEGSNGRSVGVLTRNLYLGADLTPVIQSQNLQQFLTATTAVWTMVKKSCWPEDLTVTAPGFNERIDYLLTRGPLDPRSAEVFGTDPASRVSGLWPSDHGGVFAAIRLAGDKDEKEDD